MTTSRTRVPDAAPVLEPVSGRFGSCWAWACAVAGALGVAGIQVSSSVDAVYNERYVGDAVLIRERLGEQIGQMVATHLLMTTAAVLLLVVAAGLRRRLAARTPAGSLLPDVAASGLALTSAVLVLGLGLTTETIFGVAADEDLLVDAEFAAVAGHWFGTIPWLWIGAGVTGVAVAVASFRHRAVARWVGWVSIVLGGITLLFGLSPLQYMAGFVAPVYLLVLGLALALGDKGDPA